MSTIPIISYYLLVTVESREFEGLMLRSSLNYIFKYT